MDNLTFKTGSAISIPSSTSPLNENGEAAASFSYSTRISTFLKRRLARLKSLRFSRAIAKSLPLIGRSLQGKIQSQGVVCRTTDDKKRQKKA